MIALSRIIARVPPTRNTGTRGMRPTAHTRAPRPDRRTERRNTSEDMYTMHIHDTTSFCMHDAMRMHCRLH